MRHQIIQHNKFYLNKYLLIEDQVQEKVLILKISELLIKLYKGGPRGSSLNIIASFIGMSNFDLSL